MLRPAGRAAQPGRVAAAGGVPAGPPANQRAPGPTVDRWRTSRDPRPYPLPPACGFPSLARSLALGQQRRRGRVKQLQQMLQLDSWLTRQSDRLVTMLLSIAT